MGSRSPRHLAQTSPRTTNPIAQLRRPVALLALSIGAAIVAGFITGTVTQSSAVSPVAATYPTVDSSLRQQAAERVDRAARTGTAVTASASAPAAATTQPDTPKPPAWVLPMIAPLSSCFGWRWGAMHQGIDFVGPEGAKIRSVGAGTVVSAGWLYTGYGMSVIVDHGNGYFSHYAHAEKILVHVGQKVAAGTPLALEGSTGDSTGPHLHFEIHQGLWNQINPANWLRNHGLKVGC